MKRGKRKIVNNNPVAVKINQLPRMVRLICGMHDAWIVGSAADPKNHNPKDYDIAVSWKDWHKVAMHIPKDARPTLFGGWKFVSDGRKIDIWPDEVVKIFYCSKCEWMWQIQHNIRIQRYHEEL